MSTLILFVYGSSSTPIYEAEIKWAISFEYI